MKCMLWCAAALVTGLLAAASATTPEPTRAAMIDVPRDPWLDPTLRATCEECAGQFGDCMFNCYETGGGPPCKNDCVAERQRCLASCE